MAKRASSQWPIEKKQQSSMRLIDSSEQSPSVHAVELSQVFFSGFGAKFSAMFYESQYILEGRKKTHLVDLSDYSKHDGHFQTHP